MKKATTNKELQLLRQQRYGRQILLPEVGMDGQQRLANSCVSVVGAGGLGSAILPLIVGAGIGSIRLFDADIVSLSNLHRQVIYNEGDVGGRKAIVCQQKLQQQNGQCHIEAFCERLDENNAVALLSGSDLILDATDNLPTRLTIDGVAAALGIPWIYSSLRGWNGQLAIFGGQGGVYGRYTDLFGAASGTINPEDVEEGAIPVMATTPTIIGSIAAAECLKFLLGLDCPLTSSLMLVDTLGLEFKLIGR